MEICSTTTHTHTHTRWRDGSIPASRASTAWKLHPAKFIASHCCIIDTRDCVCPNWITICKLCVRAHTASGSSVCVCAAAWSIWSTLCAPIISRQQSNCESHFTCVYVYVHFLRASHHQPGQPHPQAALRWAFCSPHSCTLVYHHSSVDDHTVGDTHSPPRHSFGPVCLFV